MARPRSQTSSSSRFRASATGLAADVIGLTRPTSDDGIRVYINTGVLMPGLVMYMLVTEHAVGVFHISFDTG